MNAIDGGFGWLGGTVAGWLPAGAIQSLIRDGLIAGVGAVLVFLPQVLILFAIIAVLEDCGYMARAAFVMDRLLSKDPNARPDAVEILAMPFIAERLERARRAAR
jgi:ferrous iron transport protein B